MNQLEYKIPSYFGNNSTIKYYTKNSNPYWKIYDPEWKIYDIKWYDTSGRELLNYSNYLEQKI